MLHPSSLEQSHILLASTISQTHPEVELALGLFDMDRLVLLTDTSSCHCPYIHGPVDDIL